MPHWNNRSKVYEGPKDFRMISRIRELTATRDMEAGR